MSLAHTLGRDNSVEDDTMVHEGGIVLEFGTP
jgi:hypothetical protein